MTHTALCTLKNSVHRDSQNSKSCAVKHDFRVNKHGGLFQIAGRVPASPDPDLDTNSASLIRQKQEKTEPGKTGD